MLSVGIVGTRYNLIYLVGSAFNAFVPHVFIFIQIGQTSLEKSPLHLLLVTFVRSSRLVLLLTPELASVVLLLLLLQPPVLLLVLGVLC